MSIHTMLAAAAVPANIFTSGANAATQIMSLLMAVAMAVIAWLLLKMLMKAGTWVAAGMALVLGAVLFWGLGEVRNSSVQQNLTDTINDTFGLPVAPAPDHSTGYGPGQGA